MQDTSSDKIDNYTKNTEKKGSDFVRYFFSIQMDPDWVYNDTLHLQFQS